MKAIILAEETLRTDALLVHYSTNYVFDGSKTGPRMESDKSNPSNEELFAHFGIRLDSWETALDAVVQRLAERKSDTSQCREL
jgi:RmlD substrate binding domain